MKKVNFKSFLLGCVTSSVICVSSVPAIAAMGEKLISVNFKNISIVANGQVITPKDANGAVLEPFIFNGSTYLPIKAVGEALGESVVWSGNDNTVYIGKIFGKQEDFMEQCKPYQYGGYGDAEEYLKNDGKSFNMSGKNYTSGFVLAFSTSDDSYALINLDSKYSMLSVDVGHVDDSTLVDTVLSVYLDGNLSGEYELDADGGTKRLDIPLNYAKQVKFAINDAKKHSGYNGAKKYGFGNGTFIK